MGEQAVQCDGSPGCCAAAARNHQIPPANPAPPPPSHPLLSPSSPLSPGLAPSRRQFVSLVLLLGSLTALGPLAIDMYLPSFPRVAAEFGVTTGAVERTLAVYFVGLAFGQLLYGPMSDRFGRKLPLYVGLALFAAASVGCAVAVGIGMLTVVRFCQALGGCALMVVSRAVVRDHFDARDAARMFSSLILVMGVTPVLAPLLGGWMAGHFGWRSIFWFQSGASLACLIATAVFLKESHPVSRRTTQNPRTVARIYARLLSDRVFMSYALTGAFVMMGMFAYISGSAHAFMQVYGVSEQRFGLFFGMNAAGFIAASQVNAWLLKRVEPRRALRVGVCGAAAAGMTVLTMTATGVGGFTGVLIPVFCFMASLGFILPTATALALAPHGREAGNASAVLGFVQFAISAGGASLVSAFHTGSALPMAAIIAGGALMALVAHPRTTADRQPAAPAADGLSTVPTDRR